MEDFAIARSRMIDSQLRTESVTDYGVLNVMGAVPREQFVPAQQRALAYLDRDVPLTAAGEASRYLMEAAPFARLVQLAAVQSTDHVLDVGCATGYSTAVLARLAGSVVGLESDATLAAQATDALRRLGAANATVVVGPLAAGHAAGAPYDVIIIEGSVDTVPEALFAQLKDEGRLVAVVGRGLSASATVFTKSEGQIGDRIAFNADVRPLPGFANPEVFVF